MSRTSDFSAAPPQGQAGAMFIGATHYASPWTLLLLYRPWRRMVRQMTRMRGYRWHRTYYEWPLTLGTIAFFDDRGALLKFARSSEHRHLMCWLTDDGTKRARAGFIRIYEAHPQGYSNGTWRAEDGSMGHIPTFSPLEREAAQHLEGPPVHRKHR
jgi:hypothetical protein